MDLKNKTANPAKVKVDILVKTKNGIAKIKLKIAKIVVKEIAK
jgi:hypothetical protein